MPPRSQNLQSRATLSNFQKHLTNEKALENKSECSCEGGDLDGECENLFFREIASFPDNCPLPRKTSFYDRPRLENQFDD